jgi:Spx/MgsR family transcriptional regulator
LAEKPVLYGIPNCDTVRKARRWLDQQALTYDFHDLRADGIDGSLIRQWIERAGWETVVNRRSSSWKTLDPALREAMDASSAIDAVLAQPTLVKRPVLVDGDTLEFGFSEARYRELLT